jgi:hypothetical protein
MMAGKAKSQEAPYAPVMFGRNLRACRGMIDLPAILLSEPLNLKLGREVSKVV